MRLKCRKTVNNVSLLLLLAMASISFANENVAPRSASKAVGFSAGWISGNGITYRHYFGNHFLQGTVVGVVSNNANDAYVNTAFSAGTYLHKLEASGIIPPLGLKIMAGVDLVIEKRREAEGKSSAGGSSSSKSVNHDSSYYGGGVGIDIGNPGRAGLSLWIAVNYVFAYDGISSPSFDWFGARPAAGILYGW